MYTVVDRMTVTMLSDHYSAEFCHFFKFEARVGGYVSHAARCAATTHAEFICRSAMALPNQGRAGAAAVA
jgi:hypothetical protein